MRLVDSEGEVFGIGVFRHAQLLQEAPVHPGQGRTLDDLPSPACSRPSPGWEGCPECLTDSMSCLVTASGREEDQAGEGLERFAREAGFELRLCAPRSPQTKGKDESANRFLNRLLAYGGEVHEVGRPRRAVARIEARRTRSRTGNATAKNNHFRKRISPNVTRFRRPANVLSPTAPNGTAPIRYPTREEQDMGET